MTREKSLAEIHASREGYMLLLLAVFRPEVFKHMNLSSGKKAERYGKRRARV